jgi:hypothetical protein
MARHRVCSLLLLLTTSLLGACADPDPREVTAWAKRFPAGNNVNVGSIAIDGYSGAVALAGTFRGTLDFGAGPQQSSADTDLFLVELDGDGEAQWGGHTGLTAYQPRMGIAVAPNGDVIAAGTFTSSIAFGGAPLTSNGQSGFLARFDAGGTLLWDTKLGTDSSNVRVTSVAVDRLGDIVLAGSFSGEAALGGAALASPSQASFVAKYDGEGGPIFGRMIQGSGHEALAVAPDAFGNTVIYGENLGNIYFGEQSFFSAGRDGYVAKVDARGGDLWFVALRDTSSFMQPMGLAVGSAGEVVVSGAFAGTLNMGEVAATSSSPSKAAFVGMLSTAGEPLWIDAFDGDGGYGNEATSVALGEQGRVYVTGTYAGNANFGGGALPFADNRALFVSEIDARGALRETRTFEGASGLYSEGQALAHDPAGGLVLAGAFNGRMRFDGEELVSTLNGRDLFVARLTTPLAAP